MPTVMSMKWAGVTREQYEAAREAVRFEAEAPAGGMLHVAWFDEEGLRAVDVWNSAEEFQRFAEERLMPGVADLGLPGEPMIEMFEAHNVYTPAYEPVGAAGSN